MSERVPAQNKTSATPSQATQASSPLLHRRSLTDEQSESLGGNSNISKELGGIQPKTICRSLNWQNISVEAPSRNAGRSLPGGTQLQQEEPSAVSGSRVSADSAQKSPLELSNSTISTERLAQKPLIARAPFNGRNIPVEAPPRSAASSAYPGGIQRLAASGVKEQEKSTKSLQRQPEEEIQGKSSEGEPQEKEAQNKELVQTKLTVGAPGDKYEQEADSMAAKVMTMPDSALQQPIQRQTDQETEAVQMQPLVNSITPLVQRQTAEDSQQVQLKKPNGSSSQASNSVESRLADSKGGGSALPDDVRSFMEPRFGADFSSVRVHTDSNAVQMNKELGAQAFAHGSDVYFGEGKSPGNNELTAHELTHVVQQTGASPLNAKLETKVNPKSRQESQAKTISTSLQAGTYIQRDSKVSGTKGVTPDVAIKVLENMSRGEPPFRPDLSLGGCEWMTTEGNPHVGIGADKKVTLPVEAIRPKNPLIFQSSDLDAIFNEKLSQITDQAAEAEFRRQARISNDQLLNSAQRKNVRGRFKNRMAERLMWEEVGKRVRSSKAKVGEVVLQNSQFSKQGNGKFLVVADRTKINVKGGISTVIKALEKSGATAEPAIKEAAHRLISGRNAGRVQAVLKYGGRILIVVALAAEGYKIYHAQNKVKAVVESAGGWAGASAGAAAFATWFAPANVTGPWAWAAYGVGTLVAGGVGYWVGSETSRTIYELVLEE
jgi:hypothetical protein